MKQYRQGDVLIEGAAVPKGTTEVPRVNDRVILAEGEATGHAHAIMEREATLLTTAENERFLRIVGSGATVVHEEHATITLPPGEYRVTRQREYSPEAIRQVVD